MKLGKLFLVGLTAVIGFNGIAQEQTEQERECDRRRFLAGEAIKKAQTEGIDAASQTKFYQEATRYYVEGEKLCDGLDQANWERLVLTLQYSINGEADADRKRQYNDTLVWAFNGQEKAGFYDTSNDLLRASTILQSSNPDRAAADKYYQSGIKASQAETHESYIAYAYYNAVALYGTLQGEEQAEMKKRLINDYFWFSKLVAEAGMSVRTQETLSGYLNTIVQSCDDLLPEIDGFIANLPEDQEVATTSLSNMMKLMEDKGCDSSPEYMALVEKMIEVNPTSLDAQIAKAKLLISKRNYSEAISTYKTIKGLTEDAETQDLMDLNIAKAYLASGSYTSAHNAGKAVGGKYRGEGMKVAAQAVAASAMSCGDSTFERKCNYVYAEQLMSQARAAGVSGPSYKSNFPTDGDIFDNGSPTSVSLSCWGVSVNPKG